MKKTKLSEILRHKLKEQGIILNNESLPHNSHTLALLLSVVSTPNMGGLNSDDRHYVLNGIVYGTKPYKDFIFKLLRAYSITDTSPFETVVKSMFTDNFYKIVRNCIQDTEFRRSLKGVIEMELAKEGYILEDLYQNSMAIVSYKGKTKSIRLEYNLFEKVRLEFSENS